MEERKAAKDLEGYGQKPKNLRDTVAVVDVRYAKEKRGSTDTAKAGDKRVADSQRGTKKAAVTRNPATTANVAQCEAARQWAAEETSDTSTVTQSTGDKGSTRLRAVMKAGEVKKAVSTETSESLDAQKFIASQYPPVDEVVSSTVRIGRSFLSGAMWR